jgi:hypothetical protein
MPAAREASKIAESGCYRPRGPLSGGGRQIHQFWRCCPANGYRKR